MSNDLILREGNNSVAVNLIQHETLPQTISENQELTTNSASINTPSIIEANASLIEPISNTSLEISEPLVTSLEVLESSICQPLAFQDAFCLSETLKQELKEINIEPAVQKALEALDVAFPTKETEYLDLLKDLTEIDFKVKNIMMKATKEEETIYKCSLCGVEVEEFEKDCPSCRAEFMDLGFENFDEILDWKNYDCI